jgi:hypothetical protein
VRLDRELLLVLVIRGRLLRGGRDSRLDLIDDRHGVEIGLEGVKVVKGMGEDEWRYAWATKSAL